MPDHAVVSDLFALRISRTVFSALSGTRLLACLIVAPQRGYDEPGILSYAISSFCPTSADGLQLSQNGPLEISLMLSLPCLLSPFRSPAGRIELDSRARASRRGSIRERSSPLT